MLDQGRNITQAVKIPVIGDADTGYGNTMNVRRLTRRVGDLNEARLLSKAGKTFVCIST